jgi:hypothetical protein
VKTLTGEVRLPTMEEMNDDTEREKLKKAEMGIADRSIFFENKLQVVTTVKIGPRQKKVIQKH